MNVAGTKSYPCLHHRARLPTEPGTYTRACDVCGTRWTLHVEHSTTLTTKLGNDTLYARWERAAEKASA